jgi:hypothetical protein
MIIDKKYVEIPELFFNKYLQIAEENKYIFTNIFSDFAIHDTIVDFNTLQEIFVINTWKGYYEFDGSKLLTFNSPIIQVFHFKLDGFILSKEELIVDEIIKEVYSRCTIVDLVISPIKRVELFDEKVIPLEL